VVVPEHAGKPGICCGLRDRFREFPLVLEVRHASWTEPGMLDVLAQLEIGLCNIDQPLFKRSIKPSGVATSTIGYVRLHGRNYESWFKENSNVRERHDYLYSPHELEPWIDRIKQLTMRPKTPTLSRTITISARRS